MISSIRFQRLIQLHRNRKIFDLFLCPTWFVRTKIKMFIMRIFLFNNSKNNHIFDVTSEVQNIRLHYIMCIYIYKDSRAEDRNNLFGFLIILILDFIRACIHNNFPKTHCLRMSIMSVRNSLWTVWRLNVECRLIIFGGDGGNNRRSYG